MTRWFQVGYVARAHGLRGELGIKPFDPESEVLLGVRRLRLRRKTGEEGLHVVVQARPAAKEHLICLEGVEDRTAAEALVGAAVEVDRADLPAPADGEFFQGDLVGLQAYDSEGVLLGEVCALWETGPVPNLVIRGPDHPELLIPFADDFVPEVDLEQRRITVRLPEFLE